MSYRTTVEFNHDFAHKLNEDHSRWLPQLFHYFNSASKDYFPDRQGITLIKTQHHSDKDLISDFEWRLSEKDKEIERLQAELDELAEKFLATETVEELREQVRRTGGPL